MQSDKKGLVIYADDDPDDLYLVSEGFFKYAPKIDLITVRDGIELLECLNTLDSSAVLPCLIVLDINMPRMDGKAALRELRKMEKYKNVPAVLFTTSNSYLDTEFAIALGAGFITKPRTFANMRSIIERFFHQCSEEVRKNLFVIE